MGWTRKPCPGCGEGRRRESDKVCELCKADFAIAKKVREREAKPRGSELVKMSVPGWWPGYYYGNGNKADGLSEAFTGAVIACAKETAADMTMFCNARTVPERREHAEWCKSYLLPKGAVDAVDALHAGIQEALDQAYKRGVRHGKNVLVQLASGEIGIEMGKDDSGGDE